MLNKIFHILTAAVVLSACTSASQEPQNTDSLIKDGVEVVPMDSPNHNMPVVPVDTNNTNMPTVDLKADSIQPK